jgi:translation elongation factor EF-Tu-like GTPase
MPDLIKIIAKIKLLANGRQTPFISGYRPLFNFNDAWSRVSGRIDLINMDQFEPGKEGQVYVTFIKGMIDNDIFVAGQRFTFGENEQSLGEGEIVRVVDERNETEGV